MACLLRSRWDECAPFVFPVCDLRFAICDFRFAISDFRFAIFDLRCAFQYLRFAVCALRCAVYDLHFAVQLIAILPIASPPPRPQEKKAFLEAMITDKQWQSEYWEKIRRQEHHERELTESEWLSWRALLQRESEATWGFQWD